jgi:6-phosphogluconate dehydrogenase
MKVGLIGLGRMGEGMSRRMMKAGIEVWGYRRNYVKAQEAYEKGYVNGVVTTIENLVKVVKKNDQPGIFQMVVPAETVEETIDELLRYCGEGDIIIDHGNSNFKDSRKRAEHPVY